MVPRTLCCLDPARGCDQLRTGAVRLPLHGDDEARGGGGTPAEQRPGEEDLHVQPHVERPVRGRGGGEVDRPTADTLCAVQSDASSKELIN